MVPVPRDGETMGEVMFPWERGDEGANFRNSQATDKAFCRRLVSILGDLGVVHPDGYIQLKDRSKDSIISGGENISSIEIEDALYQHPGIEAAAVVAMPHEKWGETPCAFIELSQGQDSVAPEALREWCRERLAGYKIPGRFVFTTIARTSTGKVQKFKLREQAKALVGQAGDKE